MVKKDKDLFLDMLENPNLTLEDMVSVGHSAESTRFLDKSAYENSQRVRDKFMDSEGNFKKDEFDRWYSVASQAYQDLTDKDSNLSLLNVTAFNESDITVSPDKRTLNTKPIVSFSPNPDRLSTSIYRIGKTSERERTQSELAQAEKVLLNPVEAALDPSKAKWGDSPNDSWWGNFFGTQVLALWDEDGEHIDPVTKKKVKHSKGELKLNDNGTYYYEALDGRDIYGRQVLNKFNTITTDGSFWNQYDFFDSDDILEKSFVGSVAKNLALVGSMFIPYVGWGIAGASVLTQMTGLAGTLGKMFTGSDSPTFSAMEGWAKSFNRQEGKSEYAQQNMLCWENFLNLIGDTTGQLREQRAIFKFVPAIFGKGKYGIQSQHFGMNGQALKEAELASLRKTANPNLSLGQMARAVGGEDIRGALVRAEATKESIFSSIADDAVKKYFENYNKLGEQVARAYMVGITVGDTYGEAKEAGATDFEATMLTLGYAAAENKLLSSELGRWIFPELKAERATMTLVAKKLTELPKELTEDGLESSLKSSGFKAARAKIIGKRIAEMPQDVREASKVLGKLDDTSRLAWMKKWFNAGKEAFNTQKAVMKGTMGAAVANALAEGTEEVSEELLHDFFTSCFNIAKAAQGNKDVRMQGFLGEWDWNQALKRYGMSFFGGLIGGGINSAATDYTQFKDIANMTSELAMQLLVWMERNNEMDKFWDIVSKLTLGDKYHSTERNEDGTFKIGDENNNLDLEVKKALRALINMVHNILAANGASVDDEGLIGLVMNALPADKTKNVLGDFRANALAKSVTAGRFLKEYNKLCGAIVLEAANLKKLNEQAGDVKSNIPEDLQVAIKESLDALKTLQEAKDKLLQGERTAEFFLDAMFETTYGVSETFLAPTEIQFMELETGKPYSLITKEEKEELSKKYAEWSKSERAEQVHKLALIFFGIARNTSNALLQSAEVYQQIKEGQLKHLQEVTQVSAEKLQNIMQVLKFEEDDKISAIQEIILGMAMDTGKNTANPLGLSLDLELNIVSTEGSISDMQNSLMEDSEAYINRINEITSDTTLTDDEKVPLMIGAFIDNVFEGLNSTSEEILKAGYIHPEVKRNFVPTLKQTMDYCEELSQMLADQTDYLADQGEFDVAYKYAELEDRINEILNILNNQISDINDLSYTPISENLRNFAIGAGADQNILTLIEYAINKEKSYQDDVSNILLDDSQVKQFEEALKILKLYRSAIIAARNDNADVEHIFGFNAALNELCKSDENWEVLAEIDADTAELALLDVNMAIDRLNAIRGISDLNQGNKLNILNYTAANTNYILYNKTRKLITTLLNEDDDDAKEVRANWNNDGALDELALAVENMSAHKELSGNSVSERTLSLDSELKEAIEREHHLLEDAIYNFFLKNKDKLENNDSAKKALVLFIKAGKFDLYDKNEDLLTQSSETIDDSAYLWWLASKVALKSSDFYKEYRKIISDDIAPIPTLELGVFAAIAAIYNGDVIKAFGNAMKQFIFEDWQSKSDVSFDASGKPDFSKPSEKLDILKEKGLLGMLPMTNADINDVISSDLVPSYTSILFIEGIPGSGKSTGVFKTIVKFLNEVNPELTDNLKLLQKPVVVAHSTQKNAEDLAESLKFRDGTKVSTYGKEELLKWMSLEYVNREGSDTGLFVYYMGKDCVISPDGNIRSTWKINKSLSEEDIPGVIFIDEWSRYTQPEVDLIHRFASEYGIQVIAGGDMDQLSPRAFLLQNDGSKITDSDTIEMSIARNITPRVPKLGVSMRTGNGQKTLNLQALQSWKRNKTTDPVELRYVETDTDLFGDKVYRTNDDLSDAQLEEIRKDIDKLIANLDSEKGEQIGYIFHNTESKLFKLLSSEKYKGKIDFKNEAAALGKEARYYIVENNKDLNLEEDAYLKSLYTGISRAELASIVIAPQNPIGKLTIRRPKSQENKLIPDNFTKEGISRFSRARKALLNAIYELGEEANLSKIGVREREPIPVVSVNTGAGSVLSGVQNAAQLGGTPSTTPQLTQVQTINLPAPQPSPSATTIATFKKGDILSNGSNFATILYVMEGLDENGQPEIVYKVDLDGAGDIQYIQELELIDNGYQPAGTIPTTTTTETSSATTVPTNTTPPTTGTSSTLRGTLAPSSTVTVTEEKSPTVWENTNENLEKVLNLIDRIGEFSPDHKIRRFSSYELEFFLGLKTGDLSVILADLVDKGLITPGVGTAYKIKKEVLAQLLESVQQEKTQETPEESSEEPPTPRYKIGDLFKMGVTGRKTDYIVTKVEWDDILEEFVYTLNFGNTSQLRRAEHVLLVLENDGMFSPKEDSETPDGSYIQPELAATSLGAGALLLLIELDAEKAELPLVEIAETSDNDIEYHVFGHTWNTNYLGVNFDENSGQPILPKNGEPGSRRIDQANGLIKLDKEKFNSEKACRQAIGTIRKSMQFDSNEEIEETLKREIPALRGQKLDIRWAFVSKARLHNTGDGGRFFYDPLYRLDNMEDFEHAEIPIKTISMLVLDESGNCVLEMPLMTLGSPFTALYQLGKQNPSNPIYLAYANASRDTTLTDLLILQKVIEAINVLPETKNSKGRISYGYKRLQDMCKLWLFTSDGVRLIPNMDHTALNPRGVRFNPHTHCTNLGSHYVKNRITEHTIRGKRNPYDYSMVWHDLADEAERSDVNYSDIMMATSEYDRNFNRIVAAGHPFILRSDSDKYITTKDMMDRYLELQEDPSLEKIVKLEILTPPEISVAEYLVERAKNKDCHYGNEFSAYRILSIIRKVDKELWESIDPGTRGKLISIMNLLDALLDQLEQEPAENHQEYMSRIYAELKKIMIETKAIHLFSDTLFYNGNKFNEVVERIQLDCDLINPATGKKYMTGVLYRPVCVKREIAEPVSGFGYLVQTGKNRFTTPDGKSYRIYSRYETPVFDISSLAGAISSWANSAVQGLDDRFPNIWKFVDYKDPAHPEKGFKPDFALNFYTAEGKVKKAPRKSANLHLKETHAKLLADLGLNDYNRLDTISDEKKFLEAIRDKFIETPGNVALVVNGTSLVYIKLDNTGVEGAFKFPEEFATATLESFVSNNAGDNSYTLTPKTAKGILKINVELVSGNSELIFDLGKPETPSVQNIQPANPVFDFGPSLAALADKIAKTVAPNVKKKYESWKQVIEQGIQEGKTKMQIAEELLKDAKAMDKGLLKTILGTDFFESEEITKPAEEMLDENTVCSITVHKKFVK